MKANPNCSLQFKNYEFGLLLPNIQFNEVAIPNGCVSRDQKMFIVDRMEVSFGGINFSPFGAVVNLELKLGKNIINLKASSNGTEHVVKMSKQKLSLAPIAQLLSEKMGMTVPELRGKAVLDFHLKTKGQALEIFDLKLNSEDFRLPAQSMMGFAIPDLDLKKLDIETKGKGKQILVEKVIAGSHNAPIYINTDGSIALDGRSINRSSLDMNIELKFSEEILEQYAIFKMVLAQFDQGDNTYKLKLTGTMATPRPQPIQ